MQSYPVCEKVSATNRADGAHRQLLSGWVRSPWTRFAVVRDPAEQSGREDIETVMPIEYEVERDIVEYLGAHYSIEPDEITDESTLDDLGLDSLGVLAIADIVEKKYGISLDDERIAGVRTLSDFKDLILLKIAEMA